MPRAWCWLRVARPSACSFLDAVCRLVFRASEIMKHARAASLATTHAHVGAALVYARNEPGAHAAASHANHTAWCTAQTAPKGPTAHKPLTPHRNMSGGFFGDSNPFSSLDLPSMWSFHVNVCCADVAAAAQSPRWSPFPSSSFCCALRAATAAVAAATR